MNKSAVAKAFIIGIAVALISAAFALASVNPAPTLSASGQSLAWSTVAGATAYEVKGTQVGTKAKFDYTNLSGTTFAPPAQPESKVNYKVRETAPTRSKWSKQAKITFGAPVEEKSTGLTISPTGKDSNSCLAASPCQTFSKAYEKANLGQTVEVLPGEYGPQVIPGVSKPGTGRVTFIGLSGAKVKGTINVYGSNVTLQNLTVQDVTIGNYDESPGRPNASNVSLLNLVGRDFQIDSASAITVEGGSWGPASACGGPYGGGNNSIREPVPGVAPENILINNTTIHDVQSYNLTNCHIEGLAIFAGTGVTVSNSKFYGNSIYDIFIQANSGGSPKAITIWKNWLAVAIDNSGANGVGIGSHNGIAFGSEIANGLVLSENHLNDVININDDGTIKAYTETTVQYNFGKMPYNNYPCGSVLKGVVWAKNVWQNDKCGASDVSLEGASMPYVKASDDSSLDYTLTGKYANWPNE